MSTGGGVLLGPPSDSPEFNSAQVDLSNERHCAITKPSHHSSSLTLCPVAGSPRAGSQVIPLECLAQVLVGVGLLRQHLHSLPLPGSARPFDGIHHALHVEPILE